MSEEQLSALLAKIKEDAGLREKFKGAEDLDAAVAIAGAAGFDVSKADLAKASSQDDMDLGSKLWSDEELEGFAGGNNCTILFPRCMTRV
jgi:predicted ribosomally synthesized peptide with nif11-like leader